MKLNDYMIPDAVFFVFVFLNQTVKRRKVPSISAQELKSKFNFVIQTSQCPTALICLKVFDHLKFYTINLYENERGQFMQGNSFVRTTLLENCRTWKVRTCQRYKI